MCVCILATRQAIRMRRVINCGLSVSYSILPHYHTRGAS